MSNSFTDIKSTLTPAAVKAAGEIPETLENVFKAGIESNKEASLERFKTCEKNAEVYRAMLKDDSYTFDQKKEIRGWLKEEEAEMGSIDEKRHERDQETLGILVTLGAATVVIVAYIVDPPAAKKVTKRIAGCFPRMFKGRKAA
ncbi:hypothetical protein DXA43_09560 [Collinsella sp. OF02-10]|uniref:hypothetical protein n=1 Tax=Collinsella sp. OF02-10 TaxID=2292324 RepID=UPI000E4C0232|nr:hypothetical protein [Collinsella sp. OF02-10]RGY30892.1 hypothetical protein DXA43_09560 [Collinsella sp. OF02-10]